MSRVLTICTAAVAGALIGALWATPYPVVDAYEDDSGTVGAACCPYYLDEDPTQPAILHIPETMLHGESYLIGLVADSGASLDSLRAIGDSELREPGASWDTVRLPLTDRLLVRASGQRFDVVPVQPEERRGLLGKRRCPTVWVWEVEPKHPGCLRLFVGGNAWPERPRRRTPSGSAQETFGLFYNLVQAKVEVRKSWSAWLSDAFATPPHAVDRPCWDSASWRVAYRLVAEAPNRQAANRIGDGITPG